MNAFSLFVAIHGLAIALGFLSITSNTHAQGVICTIDFLGTEMDVYPIANPVAWEFNELANGTILDRDPFDDVIASFAAGGIARLRNDGKTENVAGSYSPYGHGALFPFDEGSSSWTQGISPDGTKMIGTYRLANSFTYRTFLRTPDSGRTPQFLEDLFPAVKALSELRAEPDTAPFGTRGLDVNDSGEMLIQALKGDEVGHYIVSPDGGVSLIDVEPGQGLRLNNSGELPPPDGLVINDHGDYAGFLFTGDTRHVTFNGSILPGSEGGWPHAVSNTGYVAASPGLIWTPSGERFDIREVITEKCQGTFLDEWFATIGGRETMLAFEGKTFINDQKHVLWHGGRRLGEVFGLFLMPACPSVDFESAAEDGFRFERGRFRIDVGSRFTVKTTIRNTGRGSLHEINLSPSINTPFFRQIGPTLPPIPVTLGPGELYEGFTEFEAAAPGEFESKAAILNGTGGCGPVEEMSARFLVAVESGEEVSLTIQLPDEPLKKDDRTEAKVEVRLNTDEPRTITFRDPLLEEELPPNEDEDEEEGEEPEGHLDVGFIELPEPFQLTTNERVRTFTVPMRILKTGQTHLLSQIEVREGPGDEDFETVKARQPVTIVPFEITVTTTPKQLRLNQTPASEKTAACRDLESARDDVTNCVEVKIDIKNTSNVTVDNVNMPGITRILSLITNRDLEDPGVPLTPVQFLPPMSEAIPVTEQNPVPPEPEFFSLEPNATATFIWHLDAYAGPALLDFKALVLGSIDGENVRDLATGKIHVIDEPLLKWGVRPQAGRTDYLAGQPARVDGFIENVSKDSGEAKDIIVLVYQLPEGNLGGGFMQKAADIGSKTPKYYEIFELPAEGDERRLSIGSIFRSLPLYEASEGKVRYDVRIWVKEEGGRTVNADAQAFLEEEGWTDAFDVRFAAVTPPEDTYKDECLRNGIPPEICGLSEGIYFVAGESVVGLLNFMADGWNDVRVHGPSVLANNGITITNLWNAVVKNDPGAQHAILQEIYVQFETYRELGIMTRQTGSAIIRTFPQFLEEGTEAMANFYKDIDNGDLENLRFKTGKFFGSNPDLLFEPLVLMRSYGIMSRSLRSVDNASEELAEQVLRAKHRQRRERLTVDRDTRVARAEADPNVTDLSTALRAGDDIPPSLMLKIFGVDNPTMRRLQKFCDDNKVIVAFRSRHPRSATLLRAGKAWPKPKALKWKTVNDIDWKYLGYRQDAVATIQIVEPPSILLNKSGDALKRAADEYMDVLKRQKPELQSNPVLADEVRSRLISRTKEWNKLSSKPPKIEGTGSQAEITTNFGTDAQFNHDVASQVGGNQLRKVTTERIEGAVDPVTGTPRRTWKMEMEGPNGGDPKAVTGDIDVMAILDENGAFIRDEAKRIQIYRQLAEKIDMQHGESYAFRLDEMREDFLRCCVEGNQAMATVGPWPGGPKAGHFVDNKSVMDSGPNTAFRQPRQRTNQSGDIDTVLREDEFVTARHADPLGEFPLINGTPKLHSIDYTFANRFRRQIFEEAIETVFRHIAYLFPGMVARFINRDMGMEDPPEDENPPVTLIEEGPVLRVLAVDENDPANGPRVYERWTEENGWQPIGISEVIELTGGNLDQIQMAPTTSLPSGAQRGQRRVEITEQAELGAQGRFFEVGDRVVLNPGGENEEFAIIQALGSLVFTRGLAFDHEPGEMIALAPGDGLPDLDSDGDGVTDEQEDQLGTDPNDATSFFRITSITVSPDGAVVTLTWPSRAGNRYTVETSPDLTDGSWSASSTVTADDAVTWALVLPQPDGSELYYRVRFNAE